jgi:hypothetical protein
MPNYARIAAGVVVERAEFPSIEGRFHASLVWVECPPDTAVGDRYAEGSGTFYAPEPPEPAPLAEVQGAARARIDAAAETVRAQYLTSAPLQSITYLSKEADARAYAAAGYPTPFDALAYPYVVAEMRAAADATATAAADRIIGEAEQYKRIKGAAIEYERRRAKIRLGAAVDAAAVAAELAAGLAALELL